MRDLLLPAFAYSVYAVNATAQTDSSNFSTIINAPPTSIFRNHEIGSDTQLNVYQNGIVDASVSAGSPDGTGSNIEVNLYDGYIDRFFTAYTGSTINVSGGYIDRFFSVNGDATLNVTGGEIESGASVLNGGLVNISDGTVGPGYSVGAASRLNLSGGVMDGRLNAGSGSEIHISGGSVGGIDAEEGSVVDITGGHIGSVFTAVNGSSVNISGGVLGGRFTAYSSSAVSLIGNDFAINGTPYTEASISFDQSSYPDSFFTATLSDGTAVAFTSEDFNAFRTADSFTASLSPVSVPPANTEAFSVDQYTPASNIPRGLRSGEDLTVYDGAALVSQFASIDATLRVEGGSVGEYFKILGSTVNLDRGIIANDASAFTGSTLNMTGGILRQRFTAHDGSVVNISGGTVERFFMANAGSTINLFGSEFALDGEVIELNAYETLAITQRSGTLTGTLSDGTFIDFDLSQSGFMQLTSDLIATGALLTITRQFLHGDYNGDGLVSQSDLDLVLLNWGDSVLPIGWAAENQFDGVLISQNELDGVLLNWGSGAAPDLSAIPEPATGVLLGFAGVAMVRRRRSCNRPPASTPSPAPSSTASRLTASA